MPTEKDVLAALSTVMDPELNVSLVQAGMVKTVRVDGGRVAATIELTTPACPLKGKIQADAEAAVKAVHVRTTSAGANCQALARSSTVRNSAWPNTSRPVALGGDCAIKG